MHSWTILNHCPPASYYVVCEVARQEDHARAGMMVHTVMHRTANMCMAIVLAAVASSVGASDPGDSVLIGAHYFGGW